MATSTTGTTTYTYDSRKDTYWGATRQEDDTLNGQNVLGRLLMDLRKKLRDDPDCLRRVKPLPIPDFSLLREPIPEITLPRPSATSPADYKEAKQRAFL